MSDLRAEHLAHLKRLGHTYTLNLIMELKQKVEQLQALVSAARCPCCDDTGAYYDNMGEVCQCQWCYEKGRLAPPEDKKGIKQTLAAGVYVSGNGKTGD